MTCTRGWPLAALLGFSLACTRDNPAFDYEAGDDVESETRAETDSTTQGDDTTSEASADATDATEETTENPIDDLPAEACEGELRGGLALKFADPFYLANTCPDSVQMSGLLHYDANTQKFMLNRCYGDDPGCQGTCGFEQHPIEPGIDIQPFSGSCVTVEAEKPLENLGGDICSWATIAMYQGANPLVAAVTAGAQPPATVQNQFPNFPALVQKAMCDCEGLAIIEDCCVQSATQVLFFEFQLPDQSTVVPGEWTTIEQLGSSPYSYEFRAEQAQRIGDCGTNQGIEFSWAVRAAL